MIYLFILLIFLFIVLPIALFYAMVYLWPTRIEGPPERSRGWPTDGSGA